MAAMCAKIAGNDAYLEPWIWDDDFSDSQVGRGQLTDVLFPVDIQLGQWISRYSVREDAQHNRSRDGHDDNIRFG